jgi:hypothetical protein
MPPSTRSYAGRCHCGAVRFRFESETITRGLRCNCSICIRRGAVMSISYVPPGVIEVEGLEALTLYRWGDVMVNHWFCRTCGVHPFHDAIERPGHYRVNLGCVDDLDTFSLAIDLVDGRAF